MTRALTVVAILVAVPVTVSSEPAAPLDPAVVYSWPHGLVDVDNKTALVRWAMDAAPGRYEWGVVSGRSTFDTQILDDHTARMLLKDPDFGVHQRIMPMEPVYGPDPAKCGPLSGVHRGSGPVVLDDGCDAVPDTLRGGIIPADQRPSVVFAGHGVQWWPQRGAYHVGADVLTGMMPFFSAIGLPGTDALTIRSEVPLEDTPPYLQYTPPTPRFSCACVSYQLSSRGPSAGLDIITLTTDENEDLVRLQISPRVDWDRTPMLPEDELDQRLALFAAEHDLVVEEVWPWYLDRMTGGLNRSINLVHAGLWEDAGHVDAAQQAHDGVVLLQHSHGPHGLAYVSPSAMGVIVVVVASVLVFWGRRD